MRLKDKVIIVTGSTTGIGKAIAIRCVQEGARVVLNGLEADEGASVFASLGEENAVLHIQDLIEDDSAGRLVNLALTKFGKLDAVVNNAAWVVSGNIETVDAGFLRKVMEINVIAPYRMIRAALPELQRNKGNVLNVGSVNAYSGEPDLLPYSMSKGALMTMTRNLGDSLFREKGVRVNQINPGWVLTETETTRKREHGLADDWYRSLPNVYAPSGRIIAPAEIAAGAVFLLSDECGPVSGQVLDLEQYPFIGRNPPKDNSMFSSAKK